MRRFEHGVHDYGEVNRVVAHRHVGRSRTWASLALCTPNGQGRVLPGFDDLVLGVFEAKQPFDMLRDRGGGRERLRIRRGMLYAIPWDCPRWVAWTGTYRFPSVAIPRAWVEQFLAEAVERPGERLAALSHLVAEDEAVALLLRRLVADAAAREPDTLDDLHADQALGFMLTALLRRAGTATPAREALPDWRLRRVLALVEARLAQPLTLDEMAGAAGLSRYHFCRAFRAATGRTPHAFLLDRRLERAKALLRGPRIPVAEVARQSGFASPSRFGEVFRRETGATPSAWRQAEG
ncbi:MAG: AraC family transcriptional regulator [Rubritepida sp.]|jgi:AraC-like DNA-binding protein|nr:AraC family transcriptional regulator [Rubritepida sp.]MCU0945900.1 AraC family transcriptional regulator [Rubritepida sp.]